MIDVNVYVSRWPFRRLAHDETDKLADKLRSVGITSAWTGNLDGVLHRDVGGVNLRLVEECKKHPDLLVPFGSVNPTLPDWQEDVRRCAEDYKMPGIRLHPNYHNYKLDDPLFAELIDLAAQHKLVVQIALKMEDERTQYPLLQVPFVDTKPLPDLLATRKEQPIVLLNAMRELNARTLDDLIAAGNVYAEISHLERIGGLGQLLERVPPERMLLGSYFPVFYIESALMKFQESEIGQLRKEAMTMGNAQGILKQARGMS